MFRGLGFFFFKQKTAYEMRISDWSSDVCSSDLATARVRDLVDTPAADLGPAEIEAAVANLAKTHGATVTTTHGDALVKGYPMIHAVGKAAANGREPRLVELEWGPADAPRVAIVGQGVVFDSGGLDIQPPPEIEMR